MQPIVTSALRSAVRLDHAAVVHLVDVVAGQDQDVIGILAFQGIDVLVDGVGGPLVPGLVDALLRRQHFNRFAQFRAQEAPAGANVPIEAARFELGHHQDPPQVAIDAVGRVKSTMR